MAVRVRCPECGEPWPEGSRFCGRCGSPLTGTGSTSMSPQGRRGSPSRRTRLVLVVLAIVAVVWLVAGLLTGDEPEPVGPPIPGNGDPIQSAPADTDGARSEWLGIAPGAPGGPQPEELDSVRWGEPTRFELSASV